MKKVIFTLVLCIVTIFVCHAKIALPFTNSCRSLYSRPDSLPADTAISHETHLTLDILSELPLGHSAKEVSAFFDAHKIPYRKFYDDRVSLKKDGLEYFIVDGVSYTFSQFDYKDISLQQLERLALIKDGQYTISNSRKLRNQEKLEYEALAKAIAAKLAAQFGPPVNGFYKCGRNAKCSVVVGTSKTYDGDDIIALYLSFEQQK